MAQPPKPRTPPVANAAVEVTFREPPSVERFAAALQSRVNHQSVADRPAEFHVSSGEDRRQGEMLVAVEYVDSRVGSIRVAH